MERSVIRRLIDALQVSGLKIKQVLNGFTLAFRYAGRRMKGLGKLVLAGIVKGKTFPSEASKQIPALSEGLTTGDFETKTRLLG